MKAIRLFATILSATLFLSSCSDKDEPAPADANDNFITAFSLTKDGTTYDAVISGEDMTITVPYTVDLDGATATVTATPSAKIYPDPSTVKDWNNERVFLVVSYSGKSREYTYLLHRADISEQGDVTLNSQAEVNAFPEKKVNVIDGNMIIGAKPDGDITDLSPLASLKEVTGSVIIGDGYKGSDLTGVDRIAKIGGLKIGSAENFSTSPIEVVNFHKATEMNGSIEIYDNNVMMVIADKLKSMGGNLIISSTALNSFQFDILENVGGDMTIECGNKAPIRAMAFPLLSQIGGTASVAACPNLTSCEFAKLQKAGGFSMEKVSFNFEKLSLPELSEVAGDFILTSLSAFQPIGSSYTFNEKLERIEGLTKVNRIGGTFRMEDFAGIEALPDFSKATVHGIYIFRCQSLPTTIDLSATTFIANGNENGFLYLDNVPINTINGHSDMDCDFVLLGSTFAFKGVNKVGSLVIRKVNGSPSVSDIQYPFTEIYRHLDIQAGQKASFPQLTRIGGYCNILGRMSLDFPALTSIGGEICVPQKTSEWYFPKLTTVCASPTRFNELPAWWPRDNTDIKKGWGLYMELGNNGDFDLGKLEYIGGKGWYCNLYYSKKAWTTFGLASLKTVKGTLEIVSLPNTDTKLSSLSFPSLISVDKVYIEKFRKLTDFSTFAPLFQNHAIKSADDWTIKTCGYNPTYQDMLDGKYNK